MFKLKLTTPPFFALNVQTNISLLTFNTFGIDATAAAFAIAADVAYLQQVLEKNRQPVFILGGGSNILFTEECYPWLFVKNNIQGIEILPDDFPGASEFAGQETVKIKFGGGVAWHEAVEFAVARDWGGIENLSLIPGSVGAAPLQNIGAYGAELKDVFVSLEALDLQTLQLKTFSRADCQFSYRDSIFKSAGYKGRWMITGVVLELQKNPSVNIRYGDLQKTLTERGVARPNIVDVAAAVVQIRRSKLPDPALIGNAGSFFKNPEISAAQFKTLKLQFPSLPGYEAPDGKIKAPAGWLIERCGWKGRRIGAVGCHEKQALVLVNYGGAKGREILQLAELIIADVEASFGIRLTAEVNIVAL